MSTYAFVNPIVAVALGAALLSEPNALRTLAASAVILTGVLILTVGRGRAAPKAVPGPERPVSGAAARQEVAAGK